MAATHKIRIDRLERITKLLPAKASAEDCPDPGILLERLVDDYAQHATPEARFRAIQRDLKELVREGRIEIANPGGKPLRYRVVREPMESDPYLSEYVRKVTRSLLSSALPTRSFDGLWRYVLDAEDGLGLGEDKLRVVGDNQRLLPAEIRPEVLATVLEALSTSRTLNAVYRDAAGKLTRPLLHPQALLQRGPRVYLFALKDAETEPVRMYALHRMTSCSLGQADVRVAPDFDLQEAIDTGYADFAEHKEIRLVVRARGYVAELLRDCPLSAKQRMVDEEKGSPFLVRVEADVLATGQLLRRLLGCGDNVEVVEPAELRRVVGAQTSKAARLYSDYVVGNSVA